MAFIVIEGSDGSGKATHATLLVDYFTSRGQAVSYFDFPRYGTPSAYFVEGYLNGKYGSLDEVTAYQASLMFAMDRYDAKQAIQEAVRNHKIVISNRYVASNLATQGAKINSKPERLEFYQWATDLEFDLLGIPTPDMNLVLHMPASIATGFVDKKPDRPYLGGKKRDIHEQDLSHLERSVTAYDELCELFPDRYTRIDCARGLHPRSIEDVQQEIRSIVSRLT